MGITIKDVGAIPTAASREAPLFNDYIRIMEKKPDITRVGGYYWFQSKDFVREPLWGLSRCITDSCSHVAGIVIQYGDKIKF